MTNDLIDLAKKRLEAQNWEPPETVEDPQAVLEDLQTHRVELELQNEELRDIEDRLEYVLARYRALYDLTPISLLTLDINGVIRNANTRAVRVLHRNREDLVDRPMASLVRESDAQVFELFRRRVLETDEPIQEGCVLVRPDEPSFRARITARTFSASRKHPREVIVALTDLERELAPVEMLAEEVVAHHESKSKLSATRAHLEAIVETAVDSIVTIDPGGTIEFVNRRTEEMFGYSADELIGQNIELLMPPDEPWHDDIRTAYRRAEPSGAVGTRREVVAKRRDDTTFPAQLAFTEMDVNGERRFTGTVRDLTEQKQLERQLVKAQRMEALGALATGVAHDVNNLIMGVVGCLDLATRELDPDSAAARHLSDARRSLHSGASTARQLLAYARRSDSKQMPCLVDQVVSRVQQVFGPLIGDEISLTTRFDAEDSLILADPGQLEQVLLNLAINARDAMPNGGALLLRTDRVTVETPVRTHGGTLPPGTYVEIAMSDTGCGMTDDVRDQIFEPFFTTKAGSGTGLGLAMVYGTVKSLDGAIRVESEPDQGTTVRMFFPVLDEDEIGPRRTLSTAEYARVTPARCTALVVEDDALVARAVRQQLVDHGHGAIVASTVNGATRVAGERGNEIDVVIADSVLPDGFGIDVADVVAETLPHVPVIFMSAHGRDDLVEQERLTHESEFLQKPFDGEQLQRALIRTLGRTAVEAEKSSADTRRPGSVLIVDDHTTTTSALVSILEDEGYQAICADSIAAALETPLHDVALMVTDLGLPDGCGVQLAEQVRELHPDVEIAYCSGHSARGAIEEYGMPEDARFLEKPFDLEDLLEIVEQFVEPPS